MDGNLLYSVEDRRRTLETLFELLEPGGTFISSNVCLRQGWVPYGPMITIMRWFGKAPFVHLYDRATALREIREAGFVDVEHKDVGGSDVVAFVVAKKPR